LVMQPSLAWEPVARCEKGADVVWNPGLRTTPILLPHYINKLRMA